MKARSRIGTVIACILAASICSICTGCSGSVDGPAVHGASRTSTSSAPQDYNEDWGVDVSGGFDDSQPGFNEGPCGLHPKRCCETDSRGKCTIWITGCQQCP
jgi:hypothetical protein